MHGTFSPSLADQTRLPRRRHAVATAILGNAFEWFDFTLFGFFAPVIATVLFPSTNPFTALLLAIATFGVGFVTRPLGGIVLGIYADRRGRRPALALSALLMALGTALIAIAPTYAQAGIAAPLIAVAARLLQGFSAGGEMGGATAYLNEIAPPGRRAFYTSWIQASVGLAIVCGAMLGSLATSLLDAEALRAWGWRIPFALGVLIGPIGYVIRSRLDETPAFTKAAANARTNSPFLEVVKRHRREVLISASIVVMWTVCTYVLLFYMQTYAIHVLKLPASTGFAGSMASGVTMMLTAPLFGWLADRWGYKRVLSGAALSILALAYPLYSYLNHAPGAGSLICVQIVFGLLSAAYTGPIPAAFADLFPTRVLSTGLSTAYNLTVMLIGGFAPFYLTFLSHTFDPMLAPVVYVMVAAFVSFTGTLWLRPASNSGMATQ
ncbi:MFS transporter [Ralstonia nicotianae]|uniref:MFS transporter n=1 Tax=Ralstonia pseudosolanacearum TaxID=1310165 RepID=UPI0008F96A81|nr:MFS transporter [Ralstonia pseudosolanacearum]MBX9431966.1 MFS transporter [Ralstonia pseudosolanacearum]MCK4165108.1 MFS transporter [Ralstonia pseudosolanacearum]OIN68770.1 MFS transporter [Ralstonia solanacearum]